MTPNAREYLPLLHVLRKLPHVDRQIIIAHLNDHSCDYVEHCITKVLRGKRRVTPKLRDELKKCIKEHESDFNRLFSTRSSAVKRKTLAKVGGGALSLLLSIGIPLLLGLLKRK